MLTMQNDMIVVSCTIIGLFLFALFVFLVAVFGGNSKVKKNRQSKEIINMFTPKEEGTKISEYEKYFDKNEPIYKGWNNNAE